MTLDAQQERAGEEPMPMRRLPPADLSSLERPGNPNAVPQWARTMAVVVSVVQGIPLVVMMLSLFAIGVGANSFLTAAVAISFFIIPTCLTVAQCVAALRSGRRRLLVVSGLLAGLDSLAVVGNLDRLGSGLFALVMLTAAAQIIVFVGVLLSR